MYPVLLTLHNATRWLVLIALVVALVRVWHGLLAKREWTRADAAAVLAATIAISVQFVLGILLFFNPDGLAQLAWKDFGAALAVHDLRFFGLEHPVQMILALTLIHLGSARARKAAPSARQFRWAVICFTIAALLILAAIPWWRPLLRGV